jgi:hypothetical protein
LHIHKKLKLFDILFRPFNPFTCPIYLFTARIIPQLEIQAVLLNSPSGKNELIRTPERPTERHALRERERERERRLSFVVSLMAPKKRSGKQQDPAKPELPARLTRSSAKRAANAGSAESEPELPKKKAKKAEKKEEEQEEIISEPNGKTIVIEHW